MTTTLYEGRGYSIEKAAIFSLDSDNDEEYGSTSRTTVRASASMRLLRNKVRGTTSRFWGRAWRGSSRICVSINVLTKQHRCTKPVNGPEIAYCIRKGDPPHDTGCCFHSEVKS